MRTYSTNEKLLARSYQRSERKAFTYPTWLVGWREPLIWFALWRAAMLLLPFLAVLVRPAGKRNATAPYVIPNFFSGTTDFWSDRLLAAWGRWDGEWYLQIVNHGYTPPESTPAFFPIYPFLVKLTGVLFFGNYILAGVVVSALASVAVFVLFYELTLRDFSQKVARDSIIIFAVFPTVFFLAAIYTEAVFLAFTLAAFYCARHLQKSYKWWLAGFFAALAAITRNVGVAIVAGLVWEWWCQYRQAKPFKFSTEGWRNLFGLLALPAFALGSWLAALWLVLGDPLLFIKAQNSAAWSRYSSPPWETAWNAFLVLWSPKTGSEANYINFFTLVAWAALTVVMARMVYQKRFPASYLIFYVLAFLPGLCAPRADQPLFAIPRYMLVLFPLFPLIALLLPDSPKVRRGYLVVSALFLGYLTIHFVQWGWVG